MEIEMRNEKNLNMRFGWLVAVALSCVCSISAFAGTAGNDSNTQEPVHRAHFETAKDPGSSTTSERGDSHERRLTESVNRLQDSRHLTSLREQIVIKEESVEKLNARLIEIVDRETALFGRLALVEHQLKDNNIEKLLAGVGSTKPEELRATVRQALFIEGEGLQEQLRLLNQERTRVLTSLAMTNTEIDNLRMELATATLAGLR